MTRRWLAVALVLGLALPVSAQPVLSDSTTRYVSPVLGVVHQSSLGTAWVGGIGAGLRVAPGVDLGGQVLAGDATYGGRGAFLTLGPTAGIEGQVGGIEVAARAQLSATFADLGTAGDAFALRTLGLGSRATVSRELRLGGSFRIAPTAGAYGRLCTTRGLDPAPGADCAEAGLLAGVDLRFRVFGTDVSMPILVPIRLVGNDDAARLGAIPLGLPTGPAGIRFRF